MSDGQPTKKQKTEATFVMQQDLIAAAEKFVKSGQVISYAEANKLWNMALDGNGVTKNEFKTLEHILATFAFTDKAKQYLSALAVNTPSGTSGYKTIDKVKYDRSCLDLADHLAKDGKIDLGDAKQLWADVMDGHRVTATEARTIEYILGNKAYSLTDGARTFLQEKLKEGRSLTLNTGAKMPIVGFGTFLSKPGEVGQAVECALNAGYRHIDCAATYENEAEIGVVFNKFFDDEKSGIKREDVFITSKLWLTEFHPDKVRAALEKTLKDLQLKYLDLYLIHIPVPCEKKDGKTTAMTRTGFSVHDTWKKMEAAYKDGLCRAIGVSNYPSVLLNDLQNCCEIVPAVNQIERHPYLAQPENVAFNKSLGTVVTAYAPLGAPGLMNARLKVTPLLENEVIKSIAAKHSKTPAQVLVRWSVDTGVVVIPKSVTPARIKQNFDVFDFRLSRADLKAIEALNMPGQSGRTFAQDWFGAPTFA